MNPCMPCKMGPRGPRQGGKHTVCMYLDCVSTGAGSWQKRERGTHQIAYRSKDTRKSQSRCLFCIDLIKRRIRQRSAYDHKLDHTLIVLFTPPVIKRVPIMSNIWSKGGGDVGKMAIPCPAVLACFPCPPLLPGVHAFRIPPPSRAPSASCPSSHPSLCTLHAPPFLASTSYRAWVACARSTSCSAGVGCACRASCGSWQGCGTERGRYASEM
jgi:hypothetical protein